MQHPHPTNPFRLPNLRFATALLTAVLALAPALAAAGTRLDLTVTYEGPETVDADRPVSVLVFDGPDMAGGNRMVAAGHVRRNGAVLTLENLPETVYVAAVYDPSGNFTGLSGMIPGSVVGVYSDGEEPGPSPITVGRRTRVELSFDDSQRLPGDATAVVPPAVANADEGILEIRVYTLRPGTRERFIELFQSRTLEPQEKVGMRVVGQFRSLENADQFVWIRAFASQRERARQLREFYLGPEWMGVQDEVAALLADTEVLLVAPTEYSEIR